jgi:hypothetical protein
VIQLRTEDKVIVVKVSDSQEWKIVDASGDV